MEIRFLTSDDSAGWLRLRLEALAGDPQAFSASLEEYQSLSLEEVKKRLGFAVQDSFVVGAFDEDQLVGVAGFFREKSIKTRHKGNVWGVFVTQCKRGQKLGRKMMEMLLERAAAINGLEQVLISVASTQEAALRLYHSLGFRQFGCEPRALMVGGRYIDEQYMVLMLKAKDAD